MISDYRFFSSFLLLWKINLLNMHVQVEYCVIVPSELSRGNVFIRQIFACRDSNVASNGSGNIDVQYCSCYNTNKNNNRYTEYISKF